MPWARHHEESVCPRTSATRTPVVSASWRATCTVVLRPSASRTRRRRRCGSRSGQTSARAIRGNGIRDLHLCPVKVPCPAGGRPARTAPLPTMSHKSESTTARRPTRPPYPGADIGAASVSRMANRVLMGLNFFPRGGSAHVANNLARALPASGWTVRARRRLGRAARRRARVLRRARRRRRRHDRRGARRRPDGRRSAHARLLRGPPGRARPRLRRARRRRLRAPGRRLVAGPRRRRRRRPRRPAPAPPHAAQRRRGARRAARPGRRPPPRHGAADARGARRTAGRTSRPGASGCGAGRSAASG